MTEKKISWHSIPRHTLPLPLPLPLVPNLSLLQLHPCTVHFFPTPIISLSSLFLYHHISCFVLQKYALHFMSFLLVYSSLFHPLSFLFLLFVFSFEPLHIAPSAHLSSHLPFIDLSSLRAAAPRVMERGVADKSSSYFTLKVHKTENFLGSEFEFYTISLLVMLKY
jgi:hypothetical protein